MRLLHCGDCEENEENERESIAHSRIAIRFSSTAAITETDEGQGQSKEHKPNSSNEKEGSCR